MKLFSAFTVPKRLLVSPKREGGLSGELLLHLKNLTGCIVYIWLRGKTGRWVYIHTVQGGALEGYALQNDRWTYLRIPLSRIAAYY